MDFRPASKTEGTGAMKMSVLEKRNYVQTKISDNTKLKGITFFIIGVIFLFLDLFQGKIFLHIFDLLSILAVFCGFIVIFAYNDFGYRISWDAEHVYMRTDGVLRPFVRQPETSIRFDNIESVHGDFGRDGALKSKFMPFDGIALQGSSEGPEDGVVILVERVKKQSAQELLRQLYSRRPEVFAQDAINYMEDV